jgi:hypothetical protein
VRYCLRLCAGGLAGAQKKELHRGHTRTRVYAIRNLKAAQEDATIGAVAEVVGI